MKRNGEDERYRESVWEREQCERKKVREGHVIATIWILAVWAALSTVRYSNVRYYDVRYYNVRCINVRYNNVRYQTVRDHNVQCKNVRYSNVLTSLGVRDLFTSLPSFSSLSLLVEYSNWPATPPAVSQNTNKMK